MDRTLRPPRSPAPLASMCRDRCWKTYLHASQMGIRPDRIRRNFPCGRALAIRICNLQCVVWMPGRGRFGGKRWTPVADLVFLRTPISLIKMQSTTSFADTFLCSLMLSDSSICPYRIQKPVCRHAAKFAGSARSGSESCPESDCARSSTSTSATPATSSRRSSRSVRKKRSAAAQGRRGGRGASRDRPPPLKTHFPMPGRVSSWPCRM